MTLTRSQLGETPKKTEHPGFVETPGTARRTARGRKSGVGGADSTDTSPSTSQILPPKTTTTDTPTSTTSATATATPNGTARRGRPSKASKSAASSNTTTDSSVAKKTKNTSAGGGENEEQEFEFFGTPGVTAIMTLFPILMYVMYIGAIHFDGRFPFPSPALVPSPSSFPTPDLRRETWPELLRRELQLLYTSAFPTLKAWGIYWGFLVFEAVCYLYLPGIYVEGKPLEWEGGRRLKYYCNGVWSLYFTIAVAAALHVTGVMRLQVLIEEFGPLMSVAIISGIVVSVVAYISAVTGGRASRMTGYKIYDFFMGAEINPRLFGGCLDLKMFFEVRLPWYMLFFISVGAAAIQWEKYGFVSGEVAFLVMAHYLYVNACSKGEESIVTSWDIYHEKWGFMLIFWNLAGVPFSYCHSALYLALHPPSDYRLSPPVLTLLFVSYLFVYWIWDTCNSQKNRFRQQERGTFVQRKTFPQLPWQTVTDPETIKVREEDGGGTIMVDGWYKYARKVHYTCDLFFAITWGLVCGFKSPFPWFYTAFFVPMILHRAYRDQSKCRRRYGDAWKEYERRVPYQFIPYVY